MFGIKSFLNLNWKSQKYTCHNVELLLLFWLQKLSKCDLSAVSKHWVSIVNDSIKIDHIELMYYYFSNYTNIFKNDIT